MPTDDEMRVRDARLAAHELGYMLTVHEAQNVEPMTHMAYAGPLPSGDVGMGQFIAYGDSPEAAAEAGLEKLRGIIQRGEPWPTG